MPNQSSIHLLVVVGVQVGEQEQQIQAGSGDEEDDDESFPDAKPRSEGGVAR